jgi:5'(3')-deoxyribonucleotidase
MRILLDLDEVLVDFVGGACRALNVNQEEIERLTTNSEWGSLILAISDLKGFRLTEEFFWAVIHEEGEAFWAELQPLPWASYVLNLVKCLTDDWHIISSPSRDPVSYGGKVKWLKNYFGKDFDRFALTPHKSIFAQEDVLLIDDREQNIIDFLVAGGDGIVFPRYHNSLHVLKDDPVGHLRRMLLPINTGADDALILQERERCLQGISGGHPYGFDPDQAV